MNRAAAILALLLSPVQAGELEEARRQLASPRAADRVMAVRRLAKLDSAAAIDALAQAVSRSGAGIDRLGKQMDKNDLAWGHAVEKAWNLKERGQYGSDAYRKARFRQGRIEKEWEQLNREARSHLDLLHAAQKALGGFRSKAALTAIEKGAKAQGRPLVRLLYVAALGRTGRPSSLQLLAELISADKDPRVRAQAVRSLIACAPKGWELAAAAAGDPCWAVRRGAIEALAHAPARVGIENLAKLAGRETGELRLTALAYLRYLQKTASTEKKPGTYTYARFFRIPIESTNVLFAIDFSGSMRAKLRLDNGRANRIRKARGLPATRLGYAKAELIGALGELPEGALFNVVIFSDEARLLFGRPQAANARTREKTARLILKTSTGTMTNIWSALDAAFSGYLDSSGGATRFPMIADTSVFLTDGNATRGRFRKASSLRKLIDLWNRPLDVVIHCVGIGADHDRKLLRGLAEATGGYYVDIKKGVHDLAPRGRPLRDR